MVRARSWHPARFTRGVGAAGPRGRGPGGWSAGLRFLKRGVLVCPRPQASFFSDLYVAEMKELSMVGMVADWACFSQYERLPRKAVIPSVPVP